MLVVIIILVVFNPEIPLFYISVLIFILFVGYLNATVFQYLYISVRHLYCAVLKTKYSQYIPFQFSKLLKNAFIVSFQVYQRLKMMSDASDMLAAALEQMDGIIAGYQAVIFQRYTSTLYYLDLE